MPPLSIADYSHGFGGRYGVEKDKRDKAALGYDYKGETEKHESQRGKLVGLGEGRSQNKARAEESQRGWTGHQDWKQGREEARRKGIGKGVEPGSVMGGLV